MIVPILFDDYWSYLNCALSPFENNCLKVHEVKKNLKLQGGHGTGKTGNLAVNFSRQGKHREFSKCNFLHRENCGNTGKILKI